MPRPRSERTCISCGQTGDRADLLRLVAGPDQQVVVDLRARLGGRGAWVHATTECVRSIEQRPQGLIRTVGGPVDPTGLLATVRALILAAALDGLSQAQAGGALVGGKDGLRRAITDGSLSVVVLADDASARTADDLRRRISGDLATMQLPLVARSLWARIGKGPRAALGVRSSPVAAHLLRQLRRLRRLG